MAGRNAYTRRKFRANAGAGGRTHLTVFVHTFLTTDLLLSLTVFSTSSRSFSS